MNLGKVIGTVVSAQQHPFYDGHKQLLVRYTAPDGGYDGERYVIALDMVDAGVTPRRPIRPLGLFACANGDHLFDSLRK